MLWLWRSRVEINANSLEPVLAPLNPSRQELTLSTAARPGISKSQARRVSRGEVVESAKWRPVRMGEEGWGWGEARVSGAARCHVHGGLAHPQSEVRVGVKQQSILYLEWERLEWRKCCRIENLLHNSYMPQPRALQIHILLCWQQLRHD